MANRNAKLIERVLKDFSLSIGSGGAEVVNELPKPGQEHTVYELHKEVPGDFSWLLTEMDKSKEYPTPNYLIIVVETLEDAQSMENPEHINVVFWVRSESKAYQCFVGKGGIWVEFADVDVVDNIYAGPLGDFAILKDFDYHFTTDTGEEGYTILDGTGHFLDGTDFNYDDESSVVPLVLTDATNKKYGLDDNNLVGIVDLTNLPVPIPEGDLITKIDLNLRNKKFTVFPVFAPQSAHTEISYWIYTNNTWVNLDDVGEIVMPVMSIGDGGFHYTGLDLKYFDFYINDIKAECVQYGTLVIGGDGETEEDPRVCPIGYLKGIVLPTPENNHYSVEVRFTGTAEQLSGMKYLFVSAITFESRTIDQITFKKPMTLEFDGLHELIINCREGNM